MLKNIKGIRDFPEWKAAEAKLGELAADENNARERLMTIEAQLRDSQESLSLDSKARRLLDGDRGPALDMRSLQDEHAEIRQFLEVVRRAHAIHRQTIASLEGELSIRLRGDIVPQYREKIQRIAEALQALAVAADEEAKFRSELERKGIRFEVVTPAMHATWMVGSLADNQSNASRWLHEARAMYDIVLSAPKLTVASDGSNPQITKGPSP